MRQALMSVYTPHLQHHNQGYSEVVARGAGPHPALVTALPLPTPTQSAAAQPVQLDTTSLLAV